MFTFVKLKTVKILDLDVTSTTDLNVYRDASGHSGFGIYWMVIGLHRNGLNTLLNTLFNGKNYSQFM